MPELRTRRQQPNPVTPQVPIPGEFPSIPDDILQRFPSAKDWQTRLDQFWGRTNQAIQEAQDQTARQVNSQVIFTVDRFLIYANGVPTPMFALDDTGVRLGNVLVVNTPGRKVYIGAGTYQSADTPFYIDNLGFFSLGQNLTWNPDTGTLSITGTITATTGSIGGFDIGTDYIRDTGNSMGMASTVTGGDDVRFWAGDTFANRATAPFHVTESGILTATNAAVIVGTISGRLTSTLAAAINASGNLITDVVNPRLDSASKYILSDFNFGTTDYAGAVKAGTITWNTTTGVITGGSGVAVYRGGIIGASAGVATFTIDATTGAATFAGTLSAPNGNIGGWTIGATTLAGGNATLDSVGQLILGTANNVAVISAADSTYRLWIGNATAGSAAFNVTKAGVLTATGANITGSITATTGSIGGFDIGTDYIRDSINSFGLASTITVGDDIRIWAGSTFASRSTAPFRVTELGNVTATSFSGYQVALTGSGSADIALKIIGQYQASAINFSGSVIYSGGSVAANANGTSLHSVRISAGFGKGAYTALSAYGIYVDMLSANTSGAGTISNAYGLYIVDIQPGSTNYGIYVATTAANYFAGATTFNAGLNSTSIGATTPGAGAFTTLSATGTIQGASLNLGSGGVNGFFNSAGIIGAASGTFAVSSGNASNLLLQYNGSTIGTISSTGLAVTGQISNTGKALFNGATANPASAGTNGKLVVVTDSSGDSTATFYTSSTGAVNQISLENPNGQVGRIQTNGSATSYLTSSDRRLKTNIRNLPNSGAILDALQPRLFDWKTGEKDSYGFVAQEVYAIFPQAVSKGDDDPDTIKQKWAMDASKLVPILVAEIKSLRARVVKLEAA